MITSANNNTYDNSYNASTIFGLSTYGEWPKSMGPDAPVSEFHTKRGYTGISPPIRIKHLPLYGWKQPRRSPYITQREGALNLCRYDDSTCY